MTGEHPREYIITEAQITAIENHGWIDAFSILEQVRNQHASHSGASEPVPEPGGAPNVSCDNDPCQFCFDGWCSFKCRKWDALVQTAATKARAGVLDEALAEFQNINAPPVRVTYIRHVLESLRQQEGKP